MALISIVIIYFANFNLADRLVIILKDVSNKQICKTQYQTSSDSDKDSICYCWKTIMLITHERSNIILRTEAVYNDSTCLYDKMKIY